MKILLSPHNDDAALFASFICLREQPVVITVLDSYVQPARGYKGCDRDTRREEDKAAMSILGCQILFGGFRDDRPNWDGVERKLLDLYNVEAVWAPAVEQGGHEHHNRIGTMADDLWPGLVSHYMTYTKSGKSKGVIVPFEPEWPRLKLLALAQYESQIALSTCVDHFLRGLYEYTEA